MTTLYLWDQAWTLIDMSWDVAASGFADYDAFARFASDGVSDSDPFVYEQLYELTFQEHWHRTASLPGALAAVQLPGEHWVFTTGLPEQWEWILATLESTNDEQRLRAAITGNRSTFEFSYENVKTTSMYQALFTEAKATGFERIVVVDDKPHYLAQAARAAADFPTLTVELIHVATHPANFATPAGIRRLASLNQLVENDHHD